MIALPTLGRLARPRRTVSAGTSCEICGTALDAQHRHIAELEAHRLLCTCEVCALVHERTEVTSRFRAVPKHVRALPADVVTTGDLDALGVPVGLSFFFRASTLARWVAIFPSVAGATEAPVRDEIFERVLARAGLDRPGAIAEDVEALLVRRERGRISSAFVVPIDVCYELVALLRTYWEGIDGGDMAKAKLDELFATIDARACQEGSGR